MKKRVSFVICLLCALIMVATFLLSQKWSNRNNSQSLSQIREIEGLENQLAEIPTGYVNGFGESDTIYTSTKRVSTDTTLIMDISIYLEFTRRICKPKIKYHLYI